MSGISESTAVITGHEPFTLSPAVYDGSYTRPEVSSPLYPSMNLNSSENKRKRGRPRKYGPDGSMTTTASDPQALSVGMVQDQDFSPQETPVGGSESPVAKKRRGRPPGSTNKKKRTDDLGGGSPGFGFIPHVIDVKIGQDVASTLMTFSQHGPRTVCILSATGVVSSVTLRQAASTCGTATYEGNFNILLLSGFYVPSNVNGQISRTGGLSITLAGADGRVFGGCVAGVLTAASPVQVIVGSFIAEGKKPERSIDQAKVNLGEGSTVPSPRALFTECSEGPASPLNLSSMVVCNNHQGMPWK